MSAARSSTKTPFAKRQLGKRTGVMVTELGLGTAPLGETFDVIEEDEARAFLAAAWDGGVRYFDTSP
jgi:D-threo-aldose 1-dehydrogenase